MVRAETPLSPQSLQEWLWITPVLVALSGFAGVILWSANITQELLHGWQGKGEGRLRLGQVIK